VKIESIRKKKIMKLYCLYIADIEQVMDISINPIVHIEDAADNESSTISYNGTTVNSHKVYDGVLKAVDIAHAIIIPTSLLLGLTGNLLTICVMNKKSFSKLQARFFLIALAFADTTVILTQPFHKSYIIKLFGRDFRAISNSGCKIYFWFFRTGKMMSSWFVVCLCVERFAAIMYPFKVKLLFTKRRCQLAVCVLFLVLGVFNAGWSYSTNILENGLCSAEAIDQTNSSDVLKYRILLFIAFGFIALGPVGILVTLTPIIIVTIRRGIRKRQQLTKSCRNDTQATRATTMLMAVIIAFILLATPYTIFHNVSFFKRKALHEDNSKLYQIARAIVQLLDLLNYTINFFLYVFTSRQFRDGVVSLFKSGKGHRPSMGSQSEGTSSASTRADKQVPKRGIRSITNTVFTSIESAEDVKHAPTTIGSITNDKAISVIGRLNILPIMD
jgi:hypothetical protein